MDVTNPSYCGTLVFGESEEVELLHPGNPQHTVRPTCQRGEWRPPERLAQYLPDGFSIPIDCYTGTDGLRRFVPRCNFEELIDLGAVGGLAVLHGLRGFDAHTDHSYRSMQLIHQYVRGRANRGTRGMKEHLTRGFDYSRDLHVRQTGRLTDGERDVLPDNIGLAADGTGDRLTVGQLTTIGRRVATEAGYCNPTNRVSISFGLYETAKLNPLEVEPDRVSALVRMSLFDIDTKSSAPNEEMLEIVTERLLEAIDDRLEDPQEKFDRWFTGPNNSLVKQISQGKRKRGGNLSIEDVRQALLYLGWQSYRYVGQCLHALMRTIKNSIPCPLTDAERVIFERMFESQACYGDMPLALLAERASFVERAVLAIWNEPENEEHIRTLHRMLSYYAEMATKRREADRRTKQKCSSTPPNSPRPSCAADHASNQDAEPDRERSPSRRERHLQGPAPAGSGQLIENLHGRNCAGEDPFAEVAEHIRELHGVECESHCGNWEYRRADNSLPRIVVELRCECGQTQRQIAMSLEEFAGHAQDGLRWDRPNVNELDDD